MTIKSVVGHINQSLKIAMFRMNLRTRLKALTFVVITLVFANGCATHNALEGGKEPDKNSAYLYDNPIQDGIAWVKITAVNGASVYNKWDGYPSTIILDPGSHAASLEYTIKFCGGVNIFPIILPGGMTIAERSWTLGLNAERGRRYRAYARSEGDNYWAWIEDEAAGEVVSGEEPHA